MLCDICKKNTAVVFVNKLENGHAVQQHLCLPCAKKLGFNLRTLLGAGNNLSDEQLEELANHMTNMMENFDPSTFDPSQLEGMLPPEMMEMLTGATPDGDSSDEPDEILDMSADPVAEASELIAAFLRN